MKKRYFSGSWPGGRYLHTLLKEISVLIFSAFIIYLLLYSGQSPPVWLLFFVGVLSLVFFFASLTPRVSIDDSGQVLIPGLHKEDFDRTEPYYVQSSGLLSDTSKDTVRCSFRASHVAEVYRVTTERDKAIVQLLEQEELTRPALVISNNEEQLVCLQMKNPLIDKNTYYEPDELRKDITTLYISLQRPDEFIKAIKLAAGKKN